MSGTVSASRPIRVLHLRDSPWVDGPGRTILESGKRFDAQRVDYTVAVLVESADGEHPMVAEGRKRDMSVIEIVDRGGLDLSVVARLVTLVDEMGIDVLHASDLRSSIYCLLTRWRRRKLLLIRTAHGWIANSYRRRVMRQLDKMLLRYFDHVTLVSYAMRELVPRWWLPDERVSVIHNALPLDSYGRGQRERVRTLPDPSKRVTILNVGRLSPEKGQALLLRAVARLVPEFPGLELKLAGIGGLEDELRSLADELGISAHVRLLGYVQNMADFYLESDLVIQSSLTEGLPNVILEAAFLGVPIIATDVGGTREVIPDASCGRLVDAGSVDAIVSALRDYLRDPVAFLEMTHRARRRILSEFSFDERIRRMTELYECTVSR